MIITIAARLLSKYSNSDQNSLPFLRSYTLSDWIFNTLSVLASQGIALPCDFDLKSIFLMKSLPGLNLLFPQRLPIRIVGAAWCLVTAILVMSYSSLLITYILTPNDKPLINSVYDIAKNDRFQLLVEKFRGFDLVISVSRLPYKFSQQTY